MTLKLTYLYRNIARNPLRTLLTAAAVALPIVIFVLSTAVIDGINMFLDNSARQLRLAVTHRASMVTPLPAGYRARIEAIDRTRPVIVAGMHWIGGRVPDDPRPLSTLAVDADTFPAAFSDYLTRPGELDLWQRDRQALIVGRSTAEQFRWQVGDRVTILPSLPPYAPMEFHIVSTAPDAVDPITLFCRRDYLEEELKRGEWLSDHVSFFFIKCASQADLEYYRLAIDRQFANSPDETTTQDERSFMSQFITQQFDLPRNLTILSVLTVLVAVLAATNTMSMNFRDRLAELATLKSLGFSGSLVLSIIQSESLLICAFGGLCGALGPYLAFTHTPLRELTLPIIQQLEIRPVICAQGVAIALGVGVLAGAWPSWLAARLKPVHAFRALE